MTLRFQQTIVGSRATLPLVAILSLALWLLLPVRTDSPCFATPDYGMWPLLAPLLQPAVVPFALSMACGMLSLYIMTELNNACVLLRVNSRMLATALILILALTLSFHTFHPGSLLIVCVLLSYFPLSAIYQHASPRYSFMAHLLLALASLVFPKTLWLVPVYWGFQAHYRNLTPRTFVASLLAVGMVYWIAGGTSVLAGCWSGFAIGAASVVRFTPPDYSTLAGADIAALLFTVLLFVIGAVDFHMHRLLDKTRTRAVYNMVITHGITVLAFTLLQPQHLWVLLPLLQADAAIVFGHFFAFTHTRVSHIICLALLVLAAVAVFVQTTSCAAHS